MKQQIGKVLKHWEVDRTELLEQYRKDSPRLIFKIKAEDGFYILKGIPEEKPENVIIGNVEAHRFLGNEKGIAPRIFATRDGGFYVKEDGFWFYLLEFIDGQVPDASVENEELLGRLARQCHSYTEYPYPTGLSEEKQEFYEWFGEKLFKTEFDRILDGLPDFRKLDRCLIHTDLGPHNVIIKPDGKMVLIDLDDAGFGSRYLDLGYPFICQFVEHDDKMNMRYRFDYAKALLKGYYGEEEIPRPEYELLWQGAVYMQISYMQCYGADAVDSLWQILKFGMEQKEALWEMLCEMSGKER